MLTLCLDLTVHYSNMGISYICHISKRRVNTGQEEKGTHSERCQKGRESAYCHYQVFLVWLLLRKQDLSWLLLRKQDLSWRKMEKYEHLVCVTIHRWSQTRGKHLATIPGTRVKKNKTICVWILCTPLEMASYLWPLSLTEYGHLGPFGVRISEVRPYCNL